MKKFFMFSPYQAPEGLESGIYQAVDNPVLQFDRPVHFPLLSIIHAQVQENEEIEVYVVCADYEKARRNLLLFREELDAVCSEMHVKYRLCAPGFDERMQFVPYDEKLDTLLTIFEQLIQNTADGDILNACISYGTKACPLVMMLAFKYAYRLHENVAIGCVGYGGVDFSKPRGSDRLRIFDVTSLFYMDELVRSLADQKVDDPKKIIRMLLQ